ncbi:MAG: Fucose permease [Blastococcus sp.]|nr:Fucose permease [Blastococcus sp.]
MPAVMQRLVHRMFRSLTQRNYRRYFIGHTSSVVGTWMQRIGQDWLVLELSDSAVALGISLLCQFLPVLLLGVWGGVIVDRVDTRRLLIATQTAQAVLAAVLAVVTLTDAVTLPVVYALALGLGVVTVFDSPARQSFVAELVDTDDIVNAQSLNSTINNLGRLAGPALAGLLIVLTGVGVTFVINAVSFVAVLISLVGMDVAALRPRVLTVRGPGQGREGLRYVWRDPVLRATVLLVAVISVFGQNFRVVFPILATDVFHGDANTYGWLTAALGVGAVAGALASAASTVVTPSRMLWTAGGFAVSNAAVAVTPNLPLALAAVALLGVVNIQVNTLTRTILQLRSDPGMQGRVMAIHGMVFLGGTPIGGPLAGVLCELWGARTAMALAAGVCLLGTVAVWPVLHRRSVATGSPDEGLVGSSEEEVRGVARADDEKGERT